MKDRTEALIELLAACRAAKDAIQIAFGASEQEMLTASAETTQDGFLQDAWRDLRVAINKANETL